MEIIPQSWFREWPEFRGAVHISDIAGQDIRAHKDTAKEIVTVIRNWLRNASRRQNIPSGSIIWGHYQDFMKNLPQVAQEEQLIAEDLVFNDYAHLLVQWLKTTDD